MMNDDPDFQRGRSQGLKFVYSFAVEFRIMFGVVLIVVSPLADGKLIVSGHRPAQDSCKGKTFYLRHILPQFAQPNNVGSGIILTNQPLKITLAPPSFQVILEMFWRFALPLD
jgi:hypothetical protein